MVKLRTIGAALAAISLLSPPLEAQSNQHKNAPLAQESKAQPVIPKLTLPEFDRSTENYKLALEIVQITMPPEKFDSLMRREMPPAMEAALLSDADIRKLEGKYPGFAKFLAVRFTDFFMVRVMANYDYFLDATARQYVEGLTKAEMHEYLAFLKKPVGRKLMEGAYDVVQIDPKMVGKAIQSDADADWDQIVDADMKKANKLAQQLSEPEIVELMAFVESPLATKLLRLNAVSNQKALDEGFEKLLDDEAASQFLDDTVTEFFADK